MPSTNYQKRYDRVKNKAYRELASIHEIEYKDIFDRIMREEREGDGSKFNPTIPQ